MPRPLCNLTHTHVYIHTRNTHTPCIIVKRVPYAAYLHIYTCTHTHTDTHTKHARTIHHGTSIAVCHGIHVSIHMYCVGTYMYLYICTYTPRYTCIYTYVPTHTQSIYICTKHTHTIHHGEALALCRGDGEHVGDCQTCPHTLPVRLADVHAVHHHGQVVVQLRQSACLL